MKKPYPIILLALLVAAVASYLSRPLPIEQRLIRVQASEVLAGTPGIADTSLEFQAAMLELADEPLLLLKAQAAFLRYPEMARRIFPLYAAEPEFRQILRDYGEAVLPPIQYFVSEPVASIELLNKAAQSYRRVRDFLGSSPPGAAPGPADKDAGALTPLERGWYAVNFIRGEGHDFLGQFLVVPEGHVQWLGTERITEGLSQFFTSGIRNLEISYRSGEDLSAADIGWASVDVLVFASALKVLRMGRTIARSSRSAGLGTRSAALAARASSAGRMVLGSARYAKWPLLIGAGYLLVTHPGIISDLLAEVAGLLGLPVWLVQFAGWFLLLLPVLLLTRFILRLLRRVACPGP